ncbi:MAG: type II toxin-antitoxin system HicB family antitoxin [Ruminococcus sp.]|nr:type II toxin-antitoxin system HicB family antitoxin [Ruminococcus sp.]
MKDRYSFIAVLYTDEDGVSVEFPDLPGCLPCADSLDNAVENAREALGLHLWGMEQDGEEIPKPTSIKDIQVESGGVPVLIDVFMPPFRDKLQNRFVKKTLSLPAWLADLADKDGVNCSKVFQNALINYLGVNQ